MSLRHAVLIWILSASLVAGASGTGSHGDADDRANTRTAASTTPWTHTTVDDTEDVGTYVSVALHPATGAPFVSYYDEAGTRLWFARYVGSGGSCGPDGSWDCQMIDQFEDGGTYNSIAVHGTVSETDVTIAYYTPAFGKLKIAWTRCDTSPAAAPCSFTPWNIIAGSPPSLVKGVHTSVAYDSSGQTYVAFQVRQLIGDDSLVVAHPASGGTGNCGLGGVAGYWQCDTILTGEGVGAFASIAIDSWDRPHVTFDDPADALPVHAVSIGSGGNCGPGNSWLCQTVALSAHDTGESTAMYLDADDIPHLAYLDSTSPTAEQLVYATWVGSGGNCGFSSISLKSEWRCTVIDDDVGDVGTGRTVAIAHDDAGLPLIAYRDASAEYDVPVVRLARPQSAAPAGWTPNCGQVDGVDSWVCSDVDVGDAFRHEGAALAMAADRSGVTIAYHELDTYIYPAPGRLKTASSTFTLFDDGFESGNVTRWSLHTP